MNDDEAKAEWARMQGMGATLARQRMVATVAGSAVVALGFLAAVLLWLFWPLQKIPILFLAAPVAVSIGIGGIVRMKLSPKSQFD